jgi:hypothetical protein
MHAQQEILERALSVSIFGQNCVELVPFGLLFLNRIEANDNDDLSSPDPEQYIAMYSLY